VATGLTGLHYAKILSHMEDEIDKCKDTKLCRYLVSQIRDLCKYLIIILALKFIVVIILRRLGLLLPLNSLEGVRK